jgi:endo-1,4-beta-xylanase
MKALQALAAGIVLALTLISGPALAQQAPIVLWPQGAPNARANGGPEAVRLSGTERIVTNVHAPSLTPYLPGPGKATGAAVIVIPGGGHAELWTDHEGHSVARWLSEQGIAAFVLKYRLAREPGSTYTIDGDEMADARRALRLVRSRAGEWGLAPDAIGVIGFSAGSQLASRMGAVYDAGQAGAADPIERQSSRPDFMGLVYGAFPEQMNLSDKTPPAFLLVGERDQPTLTEAYAKQYVAMRTANAPVELHILSGAGHGFGIRPRNPANVNGWPSMFRNWLESSGFLAKKKAGA